MSDFYVKHWLNKYNIEYDGIITGTTNKKEKCIKWTFRFNGRR